MSYAHKNDKHDSSYLSRFRGRLEGEIGVQMSGNFQVLQDRTHLEPGFRWDIDIWNLLRSSTLFLPILTPDYFESQWCRREFEYFCDKELAAGREPLIYPVHYIECRQFADRQHYNPQSMEYVLTGYLCAEWRLLRHSSLRTVRAKRRLEEVARHIKHMFDRLESAHTQGAESPNNAIPAVNIVRPPAADSGRKIRPPLDLSVLPRAPQFFGRSAELAAVMDVLTPEHDHRIVYIEGEPGIGKTVLAAEVIRDLYMDASFRDGIAVVLCTGISNPLIILDKVLMRFDAQRRAPIQATEEGLLAEAARLLKNNEALIVLDDVTLTRPVAHIIDALHALGAALLITSTNVPAWATGERIHLVSLQREDQINLLTERMERRPPDDSSIESSTESTDS